MREIDYLINLMHRYFPKSEKNIHPRQVMLYNASSPISLKYLRLFIKLAFMRMIHKYQQNLR